MLNIQLCSQVTSLSLSFSLAISAPDRDRISRSSSSYANTPRDPRLAAGNDSPLADAAETEAMFKVTYVPHPRYGRPTSRFDFTSALRGRKLFSAER